MHNCFNTCRILLQIGLCVEYIVLHNYQVSHLYINTYATQHGVTFFRHVLFISESLFELCMSLIDQSK